MTPFAVCTASARLGMRSSHQRRLCAIGRKYEVKCECEYEYEGVRCTSSRIDLVSTCRERIKPDFPPNNLQSSHETDRNTCLRALCTASPASLPRMEEHCFLYIKTRQGQLVLSSLLQNDLRILPI